MPAADTLVVGTLADPVSLDPHRATDLVSAAVISNVCEPLVRYRVRTELAPGGRAGHRLGHARTAAPGRSPSDRASASTTAPPLDAAAVVANLDDLARSAVLRRARASASGPPWCRITLDRPNAALLATLSQPFFCMQSPRELRTPHGPGQLSGTGPFRLSGVAPRAGRAAGQCATHWGGPPRLARVVFRRAPGAETLVEGLLAGEVDVTSALGAAPSWTGLRGGTTWCSTRAPASTSRSCPSTTSASRSPTGACGRPSPAPSTVRPW